MFEPSVANQPPRLRLDVWRSHLERREQALDEQGDDPSAEEIWRALRDLRPR
jgi:hypothetical protein